MILAICGFMGSGKTTTGRSLAARLGWQFADLDSEIEKAAGQTVAKIFEDEGEAAFRKRETEALRAILVDADTPLVLALGGGTLMAEENRQLVRQHCRCVWLKASPTALAERLAHEAEGRPLLAGQDLRTRVATLLAGREGTYREAADVVVDTDGISPEETVERIIEILR
ncbi:MAG: shikimate kinase [Bacteroidales bacterium]|nr:shikimate kinase [Bacteroidales bacterium]